MDSTQDYRSYGEHEYRLPVVTENLPASSASEYVSLEPFREAFARKQRYGLDVGTVAERMEVDRERVAVLLGVKQRSAKRRVLKSGEVRMYAEHQRRVSYDVAVKLCRGLDLDPVDLREVGL